MKNTQSSRLFFCPRFQFLDNDGTLNIPIVSPAVHPGLATVYLPVSICRVRVASSPQRAAAVRPPRDERLLGRQCRAAPLLAEEVRLVARLGEDKLGCEGTFD